MYGGLDVAEAIHLGTVAELSSEEHKPFVARRGIKFNIPLDLRTPSYADDSDSAQANIPEMWSREFWREFFDEMARDRYNVLGSSFPRGNFNFAKLARRDAWKSGIVASMCAVRSESESFLGVSIHLWF